MDGDEEEVGRYLLRAEELRKIAAATMDKASRETLILAAEDYERRARVRHANAKWDKKVDRDL
jgi:hypothetical protein